MAHQSDPSDFKDKMILNSFDRLVIGLKRRPWGVPYMGNPQMDGLQWKIPTKSIDENWGYP